VLNNQRPNVLFIILESFSSKLMASLGGEKDVAVNLDALSKEGLLFRNFYATSFRTDRGLVSILSGYPAQPTTSIMKYPKKTQSLPSIVGHLRKAGYSAGYYYGGDADFTNMRSYLMSSGFQGIVCDKDFAVTDRLSKWGVHDHLVFNRLLGELKRERTRKPWFRVLQTSSSHEPYEVPYHRLANERLNAFAYTDSCVGSFIQEFKQLPQWKNTLVVLVPDHLGCYPENIDNLTLERYQIPLIMIGGALKGPGNIDIYGSQTDIAATLLAQMGIAHSEFMFSKDMLNPQSPHFAFFTVPDAFGMVDADNQVIFNNETKKVVLDKGKKKGKNLAPGKAYLQKLYDDIDKR
jgi:phosphoglycerol transferase MdoB-like AlkP superfamily enzyme